MDRCHALGVDSVGCASDHRGGVRMTPPSANKFRAYGESLTIVEWTADPRCIVKYGCLQSRLANGWDAETALTTPSGAIVQETIKTVDNPTPSRTYGNYSMPAGSLRGIRMGPVPGVNRRVA